MRGSSAGILPAGTVLDGEILAWRDDRPLAFGKLQRRLGRKQVGAKTRSEFPIVFVAAMSAETTWAVPAPRPSTIEIEVKGIMIPLIER